MNFWLRSRHKAQEGPGPQPEPDGAMLAHDKEEGKQFLLPISGEKRP
jgi:hypothetical protein